MRIQEFPVGTIVRQRFNGRVLVVIESSPDRMVVLDPTHEPEPIYVWLDEKYMSGNIIWNLDEWWVEV